MTELEKIHEQTGERMRATCIELIAKGCAPTTAFAQAVTEELTRIELRMRALARAVPHGNNELTLRAIAEGRELP